MKTWRGLARDFIWILALTILVTADLTIAAPSDEASLSAQPTAIKSTDVKSTDIRSSDTKKLRIEDVVTSSAAGRTPVPLGHPESKPGGTFRIRFGAQPLSLNPIVAEGYETIEIQFYVMEALLLQNEHTYAWQPWLADRWSVSGDGKTYDFHIRENATWSDGRPVTAHDVKFSFDVFYDDRYPTAHMRPYYEGIERVEVLGPKDVRFVTRSAYFGNFISSAGLPVVPKHVYGDPRTGPKIHRDLTGSGPYRLEKWNEGRSIALKKNPRWWGWKDSLYKGKFQPERVVFQFVSDENVAYEMLKKGELDFMNLSADQWKRATELEKQVSLPFRTERIRNLYPKTVTSVGFNLRRPLFQDRRVRLALAHLADREMMAKKFYYGYVVQATGPWYRQSEFSDPAVQPIPYDPSKALRILRDAGWDDRDGDQVLEKVVDVVSVPLSFTVITSSKLSERWLTVYKEDARQIGVDVRIKILNESAFSSALDEGRFDAADVLGVGALVELDPKPGWHSDSAHRGGLNVIGYSNPAVDRLIDRARAIYGFEKRKPLMREIYRRVSDDIPHIFLFNAADDFYAYSKRMGRPAPSFNYDTGLKFWWVKGEK